MVQVEGRREARQGAHVLRVAAAETLKTLVMSQGWGSVALKEGEIHPGDPPRRVDQEAQECFADSVSDHPLATSLRITDVVGEENLPSDGEPLGETGARIVVVDPLDGSTQWSMIRSAYCVAAMMLHDDGRGRLRLESAVIATPVHTFTLVVGDQPRFGPSFGRESTYVGLTSCLPESSVQEPSLALTGYKIKDRKSYEALLGKLPGWAVLTIGGNPVTPYVVAGDLTAAVTWRSQSTWDAIGILMAAETDAVVGTHDGAVLAAPRVREYFDSVDFKHACVPPMVVAKTRSRFEELVEALASARADVGPAFGQGRDGW